MLPPRGSWQSRQALTEGVCFFAPFCDKLRPLAGPNRAFYAELLLLLWEECRHTADYSISRAEAVSRAEDYFAALAKPLALDADGAGDEDEQPTRDPHTLAVGFLLRLRRTGWLEETPGSYEGEASLAFCRRWLRCWKRWKRS